MIDSVVIYITVEGKKSAECIMMILVKDLFNK